MPNKMLIDAAHPEETRVVVVRGNRVEEFDFESAVRKQLRGNIYLAKVIRIEPSLQAAFVEYGGNRHGFLAFSEIDPDYYQIPVADRQALLEAEAQEAKAQRDAAAAAESRDVEADSEADAGDDPDEQIASGDADNDDLGVDQADDEGAEESVESVGAEDVLEELPERRRVRPRQYKIQEVIKRRQVILIQVVKEERGNKGAAVTTYLSLAGRYSVLMPNTARGGGISRKITTPADRKRLKEVAADLEVPQGMGVILRTAGASRTKAEIKRDFEYLLRLWENVRELTLRSTAPMLVYEEGSLIKRSIRDLYGRDIDEILVAGEDAYREAKDFMRMLMPSHAKNVQPYRDSQPPFTKYGVEPQLDAMFSPQVQLPAGGYIVINQTEALVSIDVNSGRSTREHSIEDTALQTNLQAAEEVARQLRLRDLAGLVVIDFIDMEERRNNRAVEKRIKDCLKDDRARIQVGRISHFGLLEMSRQRIRTGVLESTTVACPHCLGTGHVRSAASVALHVLRSLEDNLLKGVTHHLNVRTRTNVALYVLNQKRATLSELEQRFGLLINIIADESVSIAAHFVLERGEAIGIRPAPITTVQPTSVQPDHDADEIDSDEAAEPVAETAAGPASDQQEDGPRRKRRRRRRRSEGGAAAAGSNEALAEDSRAADAEILASPDDQPDMAGESAEAAVGSEADEGSEQPRKRRRRRRRVEGEATVAGDAEPQRDDIESTANDDSAEIVADEIAVAAEGATASDDEQPRKRRRGRRGGRRTKRGTSGASNPEVNGAELDAAVPNDDATKRAYEIAEELSSAAVASPSLDPTSAIEPPASEQGEDFPAPEAEPEVEQIAEPAQPETSDSEDANQVPEKAARRGGWWQRRSFF